jgi:MoxR-like ATPase
VRQVIDLYSDSQFSEEIRPEPVLNREIFDQAYGLMHQVQVPELIKRGLVDLLSRFVNQFKLDPTNSLITDRSFLVKAVKILKAQALLQGRMQVQPDDLSVLSYLTSFRMPEDLDRNMPTLIRETMQRIAE